MNVFVIRSETYTTELDESMRAVYCNAGTFCCSPLNGRLGRDQLLFKCRYIPFAQDRQISFVLGVLQY
jgi:hypothetical protein